MANTTGAGGVVFETYVALLNPTSSAFPVTVSLFDAAGVKHDAIIELAAGELKTFDNFLDTVFDFTGGGAVTFRSDDPSERFVISAEVWTAGGRYGTTIPALEFAGTDSPSFAPGVTVSADTRTNVGCFNQSGAANNVTATVLDATGALNLGTVTLELAANAWSQTALSTVVSGGYVRFNFAAAPIFDIVLSLSTVVSGGYVRFNPSDAAVCYAVVVDNITHDGRFISAAEYRP